MIDTPTYMICMEKNKGNVCNIDKVSKCFNNFQVFPAVVGKDLDIYDPDIVHPMTFSVIKNNIGGDWTQIDSMGALGCSLSHISLWEKCIESGEPFIILEDDVDVTGTICKNFNRFIELIPEDCDLLSLMYIKNDSTPSSLDKKHYKYINDPYFMGTQAYYLTPKAAEVLIKYALPITMHIDMYIASCSSQGIINAYAVRKRLYSSREQMSDFMGSRIKHKFYFKKLLPNSNTPYTLSLILSVLFVIIFIYCIYRLCTYKCA